MVEDKSLKLCFFLWQIWTLHLKSGWELSERSQVSKTTKRCSEDSEVKREAGFCILMMNYHLLKQAFESLQHKCLKISHRIDGNDVF